MFEHTKTLDEWLAEMTPLQCQALFERIQASKAWDPVAQRHLLYELTKRQPQLAARRRESAAEPPPPAHWTSWRSLAERREAYRRLIEVEMPQNSRDIAVARRHNDGFALGGGEWDGVCKK